MLNIVLTPCPSQSRTYPNLSGLFFKKAFLTILEVPLLLKLSLYSPKKCRENFAIPRDLALVGVLLAWIRDGRLCVVWCGASTQPCVVWCGVVWGVVCSLCVVPVHTRPYGLHSPNFCVAIDGVRAV